MNLNSKRIFACIDTSRDEWTGLRKWVLGFSMEFDQTAPRRMSYQSKHNDIYCEEDGDCHQTDKEQNLAKVIDASNHVAAHDPG